MSLCISHPRISSNYRLKRTLDWGGGGEGKWFGVDVEDPEVAHQEPHTHFHQTLSR